MSLRYVAAYLMAAVSGHDSPSAADVKSILGAIGADVDATILNKLISEMEGKTVHEVIAAGMSKLQSVPSGGAAASSCAGPAAAAGAAAPAAVEEEVEEPEEEDDMGFSLFD